MQKIEKKRVVYFDVLNILACLAVVFLHHNGLVWGYDGSSAWKQSLVIEVLFYYAVPIFIMLSGATLLNYRKKYDTKTFFKKRFTKILITFVFWAVVMFIWQFSSGQMQFEGPRSLINAFLNNEEMPIYYFMFLILGIYLSMPIFSKIIEKDEENGRKVLWYTVAVIFITQSFLPMALSLLGIEYNKSISSQISTPMIFIFLGYLLNTCEEIPKQNRILLYVAAILSCIFRYLGIYILSSTNQQTDSTFMDYGQFYSVILASAVFVFVKNINWNKYIRTDKQKNILAKMAGCSFGVYLIHMLIMEYERHILELDVSNIKWRLLCPILTYFISISIVLIIKKIPYIKSLVP